MERGSIQSWIKQEGDSFTAGDVLCAIDTDKASMDFEAQDDGVLAKILKNSNDGDIEIGTPIGVIVEDVEHVAAFQNYVVSNEPTNTAPTKDETSATTTTVSSNASTVMMPSARHLAQSKGIDVANIQGTGKGGRITKGDVLQALAKGTVKSGTAAAAAAEEQPSPPPSTTTTAKTTPTEEPTPSTPSISVATVETDSTFQDINNSKMRKVIASRLTQSKQQVPHFYTSIQVPLDNLLALRKSIASNHDVKVSVNDLIIRCSALALRDVPQVNAQYDTNTQSVQRYQNVDISVAVATPTGLITPIVFNSDTRGLVDLSNTVRDLATRARDGKLAPHEYQGGTFSISNLGMFGMDEFSAVINPPQAAILAVGGGTRTVVPGENGTPRIATLLTARLSADRRVVDEVTAAHFLATFEKYMHQPELLLF